MSGESPGRLSARSAAILEMIAGGRSYAQIVDSDSTITYLDIFAAAREALALQDLPGAYEERVAAIKKNHTRAYEPWTPAEEAELLSLHQNGGSIEEMAHHFGRQPSAIQSRLTRRGIARVTPRRINA